MPPGIILHEPSKLKEREMHTLLNFWWDRQDSGGDVVFRFKAYQLKDGTFMPSHEGIPEGDHSCTEDDWLQEKHSTKKTTRKKTSDVTGKQPGTNKVGKSSGRGSKKPIGRMKSGKGKAKQVELADESSGESFIFPDEDSNSDEDSEKETGPGQSFVNKSFPVSSTQRSRPVPRPILKNRAGPKSQDDHLAKPAHIESSHTPTDLDGKQATAPDTQRGNACVTTKINSSITSRPDPIVGPDVSDDEGPLPPDAKKGPPKTKKKRREGNIPAWTSFLCF